MKNWLFLLLGLVACSDNEDRTFVRIINDSDQVFDEVSLPLIDGERSFGSLALSDVSSYRESPIPLSNFLPLAIRIGNDTIPPTFLYTDMLPPTSLPPGQYTYEVDLHLVDSITHYSTQLLNN